METEHEPEEGLDLSQFTTVRDAAEEFGVPENAVYQWIHREGIQAVGVYPDRRKIFRYSDLASAELKYRWRAKDRGNPSIAAVQRVRRRTTPRANAA